MSDAIPQNPALAALLTLAASAFAAGTTLLAKALGTGVLGPEMHAMQISHGRFLFALLGIGVATVVLRPRFTRPNLKLHVMRSSLGWGGVSLMFAAAAFIPLSDATAISFLNPVFGMMLAIPLLGEKVGPVRWSAALIALIGAAVLTRPGSGAIEMGALLALGSAMLLGTELITIKLLSRLEKAHADPADQQHDRADNCDVCGGVCLAGTERAAMGSLGRDRVFDGRRAGVFCQCHGAGGCQLCGTVFLCGFGFCSLV